MPVSTESEEPPAKCCKYCDESSHSVDGSGLWILKLDQDLVDTLSVNFPEWNFVSSTCIGDRNNNTLISNHRVHHNNKRDGKKLNGILSSKEKRMAEGEHSKSSSANNKNTIPTLMRMTDDQPRQSPPKAVVDSSPLQPQMDKNKESLKVKLMVRRSRNQLVEQGIMPPLKPSPALHEQCKQLERAKTGDALKQKILQRPQRQELERRHILEHQEGHIDPSLAEKRRMLEKALLADQLNSKISHRPGPLELIEKNILHTEEPIERIVKEGLVPYKAANEGVQKGPQHPSSYVLDEDSQSSEGDQQAIIHADPIDAVTKNAGIVTVALTIPTNGGAVVVTSAPIQAKMPSLVPTTFMTTTEIAQPSVNTIIKQEQSTPNLYAQLCQNTVSNSPLTSVLSPSSLGSSTSSLSPLSSVASPPATIIARPIPSPLAQNQMKSEAPGKDKNRKKSKTKPTAKIRAIKFHEYKGPPNAQKSSSQVSLQNGETNYQLALKQQYLLQYLEQMYKHQPILPATQKPVSSGPPPLQLQTTVISQQPVQANEVALNSTTTTISGNQPVVTQSISSITVHQVPSTSSNVSSIPPSPASIYSDTTISDPNRLVKMKVSDLKQQLKKLNLPVSGSKPALIERLKPFLPLENIETGTEESISGETCDYDAISSPQHSSSPESDFEAMDTMRADDFALQIKQEPMTPQSMQIAIQDDDIVREQQRKIEELERKLKESQQQLEQIKQKTLDKSEPAKVCLRHTIEAKMQKEKLAQLEAQQKQHRETLALQQQKNQQNSLFLAAQTKPPSVNAFITPKKEPTTNGMVTFYDNQQIPIPALFVCVQDKKPTGNVQPTHQRTASMPSIVLPFAASNSGPPPLVESSQPMTLQQQQQLSQPPPIKHHIPLPQSSPPELRPIDPIPPPHYEEATKQIENNKKLQQNCQNVPPLAKVSSTITPVQQLTKIRKNDSISQTLKDVYEILVRNGELPESAVEVSTPTTPNGQVQAHLMINPNLMFDNIRRAGAKTPNEVMSNEPPSSEIPSSLLLDSTSDVLSLNVLSPMQQDCIHNETETIDKLLAQAQQPNDIHTPRNSPFSQNSAMTPIDTQRVNPQLTDFNDLELMEFQMDIEDDPCHQTFPQLVNHDNSLPASPIQRQMSNNNQIKTTNTSNCNPNNENRLNINGITVRRDMNPSLTPSLNELIQLQQQHQHHTQQQSHSQDHQPGNTDTNLISNYQNAFTDNINNNVSSHFNHETPMDFENLLSNFEITTNLSDATSHSHLDHDFGSHCFNLSSGGGGGGGGVVSNGHLTNGHLNHHHENLLDFFNDDYRMSTSDSISCEVDNLLCNI